MIRGGAILASVCLLAGALIVPPVASGGDESPSDTTARLRMVAPGNPGGTAFAGVSTDGSHLFLASSSQLGGGPPDSYQKVFDDFAGHFQNPIPLGGHVLYKASSPDGKWLLFTAAHALVAEDQDIYPDLYLTDGASIWLVRIGGFNPTASHYFLAGDGSRVLATTTAELLPEDGDQLSDVYQWTRSTGAATILSAGIPAGVVFGGASANAERVIMDAADDYLALGVHNYLFDATPGGPVRIGSGGVVSISADRTRVYVESQEALVAADLDDDWDGYVIGPGGPVLLSPASVGNTDVIKVNGDGSRWVLGVYADSLTAADVDATRDLYLMGGPSPVLITGGPADAFHKAISDDLNVVAYSTTGAALPADIDGGDDLYVWHGGVGGGTTLVSTGPGTAKLWAMDPTGTRLIIGTGIALSPADTNTTGDFYRWTTSAAALLTGGLTGTITFVGASADARRVFLRSNLKLLPEDTNSAYDVYVSDLDVTPPTPTVAGPTTGTATSASYTVDSVNHEALWLDCQVDGGSWTRCQGTNQLSNLGLGSHTVAVRGFDAAANQSVPVSVTWQVIAPDSTAPTVTAPTVALVNGSKIASGGVTLKVAWTGADAGSGVARYELQQSTDGGAWANVSTTLTGVTLSRAVLSQHNYQFRVRAIDVATNVSGWATGTTLRLASYQQTNSLVIWSGTWSTVTESVYWAGSAKKSTSLGARSYFTFTGRSIAFISRKAPNRGKAEIYVDGVKVATVDLYSSTYQNQVVAWVGTWSTSASRQVSVRVLATSGRPLVNVDAFVTLK